MKGERGFPGPIGDKGDEVGLQDDPGITRSKILFRKYLTFLCHMFDDAFYSSKGPPGVPGFYGATGRIGAPVSKYPSSHSISRIVALLGKKTFLKV